ESSLGIEANSDAAALPFHGRNAQALAHGFEGGVFQKVFHRFGQRPKAIFQFLANVLLLRFGGNRRNALVRPEAKIFAWNIFLRNAHIEPQAERSSQLWR